MARSERERVLYRLITRKKLVENRRPVYWALGNPRGWQTIRDTTALKAPERSPNGSIMDLFAVVVPF